MKNYVVSKDSKSGMWYAHHKDYPYIPVSGSLSTKKSEAMEYAKMYNLLPNKVEEIEQKRREEFENQMKLTQVEENWISGLLAM